MHGRLGRVHDEVAQGEAKALSGALEVQGFGARPGERLLLQLKQAAGGVSVLRSILQTQTKEWITNNNVNMKLINTFNNQCLLVQTRYHN